MKKHINPLSAKLTKWPNTLKQFVGNLLTNCLIVFGHIVGLVLKGLSCLEGKSCRFQENNYIFNSQLIIICQLIKDVYKYVLLKEQSCYLDFYQRCKGVHLSKGILM